MVMPVTHPGTGSRELQIREGAVLLVDKPAGWTSFDVVNKVRHLFDVKKVGHAGTLDPSATGLLILCTAGRTRDISAFMGLEKEYEAEMILGARTQSFDADTPFVEQKGAEGITEAMVLGVLREFVGPRQQIPPMWSAAKVRGRRLYVHARRGEVVERAPREIVVSSIIPTQVAIPAVRFTVVCSKGTYIRSLVDEMGLQLGCGAYLAGLRRTRIGPYRIQDALTLEGLIAGATAGRGAGA